MEKSKTVYVRPYGAYGKTEYSPECEMSKIFTELLGQKRLTEKNIEVLKKLGLKFQTKPEEI